MTASLVCVEDARKQVEEYCRQLLTLTLQYKWITESYVVEFFVKDHWGHLPLSWQLNLNSLTPPDVAEVLLTNPQTAHPRTKHLSVLPLSLLAFRAATHALALRRTAVPPARLHPQSGRNPDLAHCYRSHVKPKKQHEIERLAEVIHTTSKQANCNQVVDIGSGQGHLSRLLSFGYGHRVTSIEAVDCHVTGAARFDLEVKAYVERKTGAIGAIDPADISSPHHVVCTVHPSITVEEFLSVISTRTDSDQGDGLSYSNARGDHCERQEHGVKKMKLGPDRRDAAGAEGDEERCRNQQPRKTENSFSSPDESVWNSSHPLATSPCHEMGESNRDEGPNSCVNCCATPSDPDRQPIEEHSPRDGFLIAGLHTCGDLGPTMLRTFAACTPAVALASVACCYMRMAFCDKSSEPCRRSDPPATDAHAAAAKSGRTESADPRPGGPRPDAFPTRGLSNEGISEISQPQGQTLTGLDAGFPMSSCVKSLCGKEGSPLTFEPLELACHFLDGYRARLQENDPSLLTQGYRAVLEVLIQEQDLGLTKSPEGARKIRKAVRSVRRPHLKSFEEYASTILSKLGLERDSDRIRTLRETLLPRWHNLVTYHCIRQLMAPIVESLVLVDRALFLLEKGVESRLVPIFDPLLSPRNLVLLAIKKTR